MDSTELLKIQRVEEVLEQFHNGLMTPHETYNRLVTVLLEDVE